MRGSVTEVTLTGHDHRDAEFITGGNHFVISFGATRLDDRRDPCLVNLVNTVTEREERIRSTDPLSSSIIGLVGCDKCGVQTTHLPRTDADHLFPFGE